MSNVNFQVSVLDKISTVTLLVVSALIVISQIALIA